MKPFIRIFGYSVSHTDLTRCIIIASLTLVCILITTVSLSQTLETLYAQLFYFPIVYATYFYPRRDSGWRAPVPFSMKALRTFIFFPIPAR